MNYVITVDSNPIPEGVNESLNIPFGCFNYVTFKDMSLADVFNFVHCLNDYRTPYLFNEEGEEVQLLDM